MLHFFLFSLVAALDLDASNFDSHVGGQFHTLVEFYAPWCKACSAFAPVLKAVATTLRRERGDVHAVRVDGDAQASLRARFKVVEAPGLLLFPAGQPASAANAIRYDGDLEEPAVLEWGRKALKKLAPAVPPKPKSSQPQPDASAAAIPSLLRAVQTPTSATSEVEKSEEESIADDGDDDVRRHAAALRAALHTAREGRAKGNSNPKVAAVDAELLELLERRAALGERTRRAAEDGTQSVALGALGVSEPVATAEQPESSQAQPDSPISPRHLKPLPSRKQPAHTDSMYSSSSPSSSPPSSPSSPPSRSRPSQNGPKPLDKSLEEELDALLSEEEFNLEELDALFTDPPMEGLGYAHHDAPPAGLAAAAAATAAAAAATTRTTAAAEAQAAKPKANAKSRAAETVATTTSRASLNEAERRDERPMPERRGERVGLLGTALHEARHRRELEAELDELLGTARPGEEGIELLDAVSAHLEELYPDEPSAPAGTSPSQAAASRSTPASKAAGSRSTPASRSLPKEGPAPAAASAGDQGSSPAKDEGKGAQKKGSSAKGSSAKEPRVDAASRERARNGAPSGSDSTGLGRRDERRPATVDEDEDDDWYVD